MADDPVPHDVRKRLWLAGGGVGLFLLTLMIGGPLLDREPRDGGKVHLGYDFLPAYVAGHFARTGEYNKIYDRVAFSEMQTQVIREANLEMDGRYGAGLNPPHFALLFAPLSALPYRTAAAVWLVINAGLYAASLVLLVRLLPPAARADWKVWGLVPLLVTASMPFCQASGHQQNTFLSLLLLTAAVTLWRGRNALAAGMVVGLLFYKPQLALIAAVVLSADLGRRAVRGLGITGASTLLATVLLMPGALAEYVQSLPSNLDWIQNQHQYNWGRQVTLLGFARLFVQGTAPGAPSLLARLVWIGGAAAVGAALIAVGYRTRRETRHAADVSVGRDRLIAVAIVCTPLLIPYYLDYDLLLLAVPATLFAGELVGEGAWSKSDRWTSRAWVALYAWCYLNPGLSGMMRVSLTVPLLAWVAAGLLARCFRRDAGAASDSAEAADAPPAPLRRAA